MAIRAPDGANNCLILTVNLGYDVIDLNLEGSAVVYKLFTK